MIDITRFDRPFVVRLGGKAVASADTMREARAYVALVRFESHVIVNPDEPFGKRVKMWGGWRICVPPYWLQSPVEVFA